jgi:hypothetical protein
MMLADRTICRLGFFKTAMINEIKQKLRYMILLTSLFGCRKPYNPPAIASPASYLVVEGVINAGSDSTTIKLSRTVNLSNANAVNPVNNATVFVQSDQGISYPLTQTSSGTYRCPGLNLSSAHQYRLNISAGSEQYQSDYVAVLNSPPIDSVGYTTTATGINIYVNTHDPTNTIKYFKWDYQETWIYRSYYNSTFIVSGDTILERTAQQEVNTCWSSDTSSDILLGSSAKLSSSVIQNGPITIVSAASGRLNDKYSILVHQTVLTGDAYNFWQALENDSQNLGSIFDAQPSQIGGNIHCVNNPAEQVIGYISVGSVASKRIFVTNQQLPAYPQALLNQQCTNEEISALFNQKTDNGTYVNGVNIYIIQSQGAEIPIEAISQPGGPILGYSASTPLCTECTLFGTNIQPSFWK